MNSTLKEALEAVWLLPPCFQSRNIAQWQIVRGKFKFVKYSKETGIEISQGKLVCLPGRSIKPFNKCFRQKGIK